MFSHLHVDDRMLGSDLMLPCVHFRFKYFSAKNVKPKPTPKLRDQPKNVVDENVRPDSTLLYSYIKFYDFSHWVNFWLKIYKLPFSGDLTAFRAIIY